VGDAHTITDEIDDVLNLWLRVLGDAVNEGDGEAACKNDEGALNDGAKAFATFFHSSIILLVFQFLVDISTKIAKNAQNGA
jgi:hypothetical protein